MAARSLGKTKSYRIPVLEKRPPSNKFRVIIEAGLASAAPPLGPTLGKYGINIAAFCKDFNLKTQNYIKGLPLPTIIMVNPDRSYNMIFNKPPFLYYLGQAAGISSFDIYKGISGKVLVKHIYEIAKIHHSDEYSAVQLFDLKDVCKKFIEQAFENGIEVVHDYDAEEYAQYLSEKIEYLKKLEEEKAAAQEAKLLRG